MNSFTTQETLYRWEGRTVWNGIPSSRILHGLSVSSWKWRAAMQSWGSRWATAMWATWSQMVEESIKGVSQKAKNQGWRQNDPRTCWRKWSERQRHIGRRWTSNRTLKISCPWVRPVLLLGMKPHLNLSEAAALAGSFGGSWNEPAWFSVWARGCLSTLLCAGERWR